MRSDAKTIAIAGFLALDVIVDEVNGHSATACLATGGSAGNIAIISRFLGLRAALLSEIGTDRAGDLIIDELRRWGFDVSYIRRSDSFQTPVVLERLRTGPDGLPIHRFEMRCRKCGFYFPRFRGSSRETLRSQSEKIHGPRAFIFDRATPAIVDLARRFKSEGSTIIFEPASVSPPRLFREAFAISHIVKYSSDRLHAHDLPNLGSAQPIVVETNGDRGLEIRYRHRGLIRHRSLGALAPSILRDSTGSGDWLTAGLVYKIVQSPIACSDVGIELIADSLRFGQSLASLNASFVGARGLMDARTSRTVLSNAKRLVQAKATGTTPLSAGSTHSGARFVALQQACHGI